MTQTEALRMALEALEYPLNISHEGFNVDMAELIAHRAITAIKEALAQPEQEPVDKNGSPCPEFWDWLPKAYNFDGDGTFTKYNMEVAFLAGKRSVATNDRSQERVDETVKQRHEQEPVVWMYQDKSTHQVQFQKLMKSFVDHSKTSEVPLYSEPLANHELQCVCGAVWCGDEMVHLPNKIPSQRTWVGLTDEEISHGLQMASNTNQVAGVRWFEAKLKEKNT